MAQTLSRVQLDEVSRIIADHHNAFLVQLGLADQVPPDQLRRLLSLGLVSKADVSSDLQDAFLFGMLSDALEESQAKHLTPTGFREVLAHHAVPLGREEREAVQHLRRSMTIGLQGLSGRVSERTHKAISNADKTFQRRMASAVRRELVSGVAKRKAVGEIAASLRKATGQNHRDWLRLVVTELNNAFQEGKLATIQKSNRGTDPLVYKRVRKTACAECKKAYLTPKGLPRIFRLSELLANGTNIGLAKHMRKPTIGCLHPHCQCELQELPPGYKIDLRGKMQYVGLSA